MTVADGTLVVFTLFNGLRFLAYVPQIAKSLRDQSGAEAMSFGTWWLFLLSHASAMAYAIENQGDWNATARMLLFRTGRVPAMMAVGSSGRKSTANAAPIGPLDIRHDRKSEKAVARDGAVPHGGACRSGPGSRDGPEPRHAVATYTGQSL